jgi:hypothetical protein
MMLANRLQEASRRAVDPNGAIVLCKGSSAEIDASQIASIAAAPGIARAASGRPLAVGALIVVLDNTLESGVSAFAIDVLRCQRCEGRLRLLAAVMNPKAVRAILASLGLPTDAPELRPARAPPQQFDWA